MKRQLHFFLSIMVEYHWGSFFKKMNKYKSSFSLVYTRILGASQNCTGSNISVCPGGPEDLWGKPGAIQKVFTGLNCLCVYLSCLKLQSERRNNYISFNVPLNSANTKKKKKKKAALSSFPMRDLIIWPDMFRTAAGREAVGVEALTRSCGRKKWQRKDENTLTTA